MNTTFSVIIPTFNQIDWLREAINSALGQSHQPVEIIVQDDGSVDDIQGLIEEIGDARIKYFKQENQGLVATRFNAIQNSSSDWLALLDSDDIWLPDHLKRVSSAIESFDNVNFVVSNFVDFDDKGLTGYERHQAAPAGYWERYLESESKDLYLMNEHCYLAFLEFQPGYASAMAFSRKAYDEIGGMDLRVGRRQSEDAHFARRLAIYGRVVCDKKVTVNIRKHGSNMSSNALKNYLHRIEILEMLVDNEQIPSRYMEKTKNALSEWKKDYFDRCFASKEYELCSTYFTSLPKGNKFELSSLMKKIYSDMAK
ncbi:glycosyltransferase family 2 protein [Pseudomaricurvus alkylphenolicus]|uniref:glycosyltransferase family 2 protein n=1 Tax=Pseudomaricurvus alkylphenolicus TaxID=1306991 RepID=UPI0014241855|nr:glycosyltransferase family A protein [Pseudomaricurvus alkylphenolicus]NIB43116.1 glycosyltransferase family 2 protein [Pseudomaricurvus alkylphenolicus]